MAGTPALASGDPPGRGRAGIRTPARPEGRIRASGTELASARAIWWLGADGPQIGGPALGVVVAAVGPVAVLRADGSTCRDRLVCEQAQGVEVSGERLPASRGEAEPRPGDTAVVALSD